MKFSLAFLLLNRLAFCEVVEVEEQDSNKVLSEAEIRKPINEIARTLRKHKHKKHEHEQQDNSDVVRTTRVVVRYSNDQGKIDAMAIGGKVYHDFPKEKMVVLELDDNSIAHLDGTDENILSVESDNLWEEQGFLVAHQDPQVRRLVEDTPYGIAMVQADQVRMGEYPVMVCVADTGASRTHPDLATAQISGTDRYSNSQEFLLEWSQDTRGHGTHVAGTIGAIPNNGIGVRGIGEIPLHITRALDNTGNARESDVMEAVKQCAESGAKIISMSLGGGSMSSSFKTYMDQLYNEEGILIFGASGNNAQNAEKWPGSLPSVVSVTAINEDETLWSGSNWGEWVEMAAPGDMILSTSIDSNGEYVYSYYSGTSMAVPHASGVAALLWSNHPDCTNSQIRYAMAVTAKDLNDESMNYGCDEKFGHGLIQARAALDYLDSNLCSQGNWGESASQGGCYA